MDELRIGRKIVIVDGVGYPAVGSICGVSNSAIASTLNAPVLLASYHSPVHVDVVIDVLIDVWVCRLVGRVLATLWTRLI